MRYLSAELTERLGRNTTFTAKASIEFSDGSVREATGDDFCSMSVEQASSSSGSFDIGAAVVGQLTCTLNNYDGRFSEFDFEGAKMTVWIGAVLPSGNEEWVKLGVYYVDRPDSYAGQISLTALDCLSLLEKAYSSSVLVSWPRTLQEVADAGCNACGLTNDTLQMPNGSYEMPVEPELADATWLDVMGYIAQVTGTFVRATSDGHIEFAWYDTSAFESEGTDESAERRTGEIRYFSSLTVYTDDVVVTGVSVTAQNQIVVDEEGNESNGEDGETALFGTEGYVLSLSDNPFVLYGQAEKVAAQVGARVVGMRLRPFSCDAMADPSLEAGDAVLVYDRKGDEYRSYVTSVNLTVNGSEAVECAAQSTSRNSAESASAATKAIVKARNDLNREKTSRELAIANLIEKVDESAGLYSTLVVQPDGSTVTYLHDRSDLESSKIVWKMTADAFAVSTSGPNGPYSTGLTADGTAILSRIYAIGIDAVYINSGVVHITEDKIYSGTKVTPTNTTRGTYQDSDGQFAIGDGTNYLRYYKADDDTYKLELSAASVMLKAGTVSVEDAINAADSKADGASDDAKLALEHATDAANNAITNKNNIEALTASIKTMVEGIGGTSTMTQDETGWTFDMTNLSKAIEQNASSIKDVSGDVDNVKQIADAAQELADAVAEKTAYITISTYNDKPCMTLGAKDSPFKARITNTALEFVEGEQVVAYISNQQLYIKASTVVDELRIGDETGYVWKRRENSHLGLRYVGGAANLLSGTATPYVVTGNGGTNQCVSPYAMPTPISSYAGQTLTFSGHVKCSTTCSTGTIMAQLSDTPWDISSFSTPSKFIYDTGELVAGERDFAITFTLPSDATAPTNIQLRHDNVTGTVTYSQMKLEQGTTATEWMPSVKD